MTPRSLPAEDGLALLLMEAARIIPGIDAQMAPCEADDVAWKRDNAPALRRLRAAIAGEAPEAGPAYWTLRSWEMTLWQPAFLLLLGIHRFGLVCDLASFGQSVRGPAIFGCRIGPPATRGPAEALVEPGGAALRALADSFLEDFATVAPLKPRLARRLLADRVLGLLAAPGFWGRDQTPAEVADWSVRWLTAMGLAGESRLTVDRDGAPNLLRGACCLAYRRARGALCESCPKRVRLDRRRTLRDGAGASSQEYAGVPEASMSAAGQCG